MIEGDDSRTATRSDATHRGEQRGHREERDHAGIALGPRLAGSDAAMTVAERTRHAALLDLAAHSGRAILVVVARAQGDTISGRATADWSGDDAHAEALVAAHAPIETETRALAGPRLAMGTARARRRPRAVWTPIRRGCARLRLGARGDRGHDEGERDRPSGHHRACGARGHSRIGARRRACEKPRPADRNIGATSPFLGRRPATW